MPFRRSTILGMTAATVVALAAAGTARAAYKTVTVKDNGKLETVSGFTFGTVGSFLKSKNITFDEEDRIHPRISTATYDGETVTIESPKHITIDDGGKKTQVLTFAKSTQALLAERDIALGPYDKISAQLTSKLSNDATIKIQRISKKVSTKTKVIPFQTIHQPSDMLYVGESRVLTNGVNGLVQDRITTLYLNHKESSKSVKTRTLKSPVQEVVEYGTKPRPVPSTTLGARSGSIAGFNSITVSATAYVEGGLTATGCPAVPGVIAVDPNVIPLGTKLYIPGIGVVRAADRGTAIIGNRIDICMATLAEADAWGRRTITIYVVK